MKKPIITLILLLLAVVLSAGCIQNPDYPPSPQLPQTPPPVDEDSLHYFPFDPDAPPTYYKIIPSVEEFLSDLNEDYNLGITEEEISSYAEELDTVYLKDAKRSETEVRIDDIVAFMAEVSRILNIDDELHETIVEDLIAPPKLPPLPVEYIDPNDPTLPDDYFYTFVPNTETYLNHRLNEGYGLGFTKEEIAACAEELNNGILKDAKPHKYGLYVENEIELWLEVVRIMNLSDDIRDQYIKALCTIPPDIVY